MAKSPQRVGIETRIGADGRNTIEPPGIRVPGTSKRVHGPWRNHLAEARGDRTRLLSAATPQPASSPRGRSC